MEVFYTGQLKTKSVHQNGSIFFTDAAPGGCSPTDLLAHSLGACLLTMMGFFAEKIQADLSGSKVSIVKEMSKNAPRRIAKISIIFSCPRTFSKQVQDQLEKTGIECPIHYSLHPDLIQDIQFIWGSD